MKLHDLQPAPGSRRPKQRVGRGIAAGRGKTAGRGQKGQFARTPGLPRGFEGGQMPLAQRLPKLRGFHNRWRTEVAVVNLGKLNRFAAHSVVDVEALRRERLVRGRDAVVKLLASGRLHVPLTVRVHRVSASARAAVEAAGGRVELLAAPVPGSPTPGVGADGGAAMAEVGAGESNGVATPVDESVAPEAAVEDTSTP